MLSIPSLPLPWVAGDYSSEMGSDGSFDETFIKPERSWGYCSKSKKIYEHFKKMKLCTKNEGLLKISDKMKFCYKIKKLLRKFENIYVLLQKEIVATGIKQNKNNVIQTKGCSGIFIFLQFFSKS